MIQLVQNSYFIICGDFNYNKIPIRHLYSLNSLQTPTFKRTIKGTEINSITDHMLINKNVKFNFDSRWTLSSDHA